MPKCRSTSSSLSSPPRRRAREPASAWPQCWASWSRAAASSGARARWERARVSGSCCRRWRRRFKRGNNPPRGTESILLVEDEDTVRELVHTVLAARGYAVVEARNGREGLKLCESHTGGIDLLVTDVVMPELGGREL